MSNWFSLSGGLLYHMRAIRHRDSLWRDFRDHLEDFQLKWLEQLSQRENLILIGGSGGHCLSQGFLNSFRNIVHIDIDPWSSFFFKRRHPTLPTQFIRQSIFDDGCDVRVDLLERFPETNSTWIWCNLLGQIGLHYRENEVSKILENVSSQMKERSWMSFHDLYSLKTSLPDRHSHFSPKFSSWPEAEKEISQLKQKEVEVMDHLTRERFSFAKKEILLWPLTPKQIHFIECGFTCASSGAPKSH